MAAAAQLEALQALLRKEGLGSALPKAGVKPHPPVSTTFAELDALLQGGIPRGQITELVGAPSSGCTSLALAVLAEVTERGEAAAYIDTSDCFDPRSAESAGVVLSRLLWVRCGGRADKTSGVKWAGPRGMEQRVDRKGREARDAVLDQKQIPRNDSLKAKNKREAGVGGRSQRLKGSAGAGSRLTDYDRAWQAANLVAAAGGFGVIVLDLAGLSRRRLRSWQGRPWMRLLHMIRGGSTALMILSSQQLTSSLSALVLELTRKRTYWTGTYGSFLLLDGISACVRVAYQRRQTPGEQEKVCHLEIKP